MLSNRGTTVWTIGGEDDDNNPLLPDAYGTAAFSDDGTKVLVFADK